MRRQVGDVEDQAPATRDAAELRAYMDALWKRLRVFARRSALARPDERWSPEWLEQIGRFWWQAREQAGVSRQEVAARIGVSVDDVRLLEYGLGLPRELKYGLLGRYAEALGEPALYLTCRQRFGL